MRLSELFRGMTTTVIRLPCTFVVIMLIRCGYAQAGMQDNQRTSEQIPTDETYVFLRRWSTGYWTRWAGPWDDTPPDFRPYYLDLDSRGNIYVTEPRYHRISKVNRRGTLISRWGSEGTGAGEFTEPIGIAVGDDFVYVSDLDGRVQKFDLDGNFLTEWNLDSSRVGDVDVDRLGNVYVLSDGFVKKFDSDGSVIKEWEAGVEGDPKTGLQRFGIAVDNGVNVYVPGASFIRKFSGDGDFIADIQVPGIAIRGIAFDGDGNIYVCTGYGQVAKLNSDGGSITTFREDVATWPTWPVGVAIDNRGVVYTTQLYHIKEFVKLPVVHMNNRDGVMSMSFESPASFTHYVLRSLDLQHWEKIPVLKTANYDQEWIEVTKFYSSGGTWIRDARVPDAGAFYKIVIKEPDFRVVDGIEYCLETDKLSYGRTENMSIAYRIANHREEPVTLSFGRWHCRFLIAKDEDLYHFPYCEFPSSESSVIEFTLAHAESMALAAQRQWGNEEVGRYNITSELKDKNGNLHPQLTVTVDVIE